MTNTIKTNDKAIASAEIAVTLHFIAPQNKNKTKTKTVLDMPFSRSSEEACGGKSR